MNAVRGVKSASHIAGHESAMKGSLLPGSCAGFSLLLPNIIDDHCQGECHLAISLLTGQPCRGCGAPGAAMMLRLHS